MSSLYPILGWPRLLSRAAAGTLILLALTFAVLPAQAASTASVAEASDPIMSAQEAMDAQTAPLAWSWNLERVWTFLESAVGNRRRLIQVATVMMCVALYFMFRARG
jgi:hypothetical protein